MNPKLTIPIAMLIGALAGCASVKEPETSVRSATQGRALVSRLLPEGLKDRAGWATDIYAAFAALEIPATPENICAVSAVAAQESGFQADPAVPGLPAIARKELDRRREALGIPAFALDAALLLTSSNGKTYGQRLDEVKTEKQLSDIYEDFIGQVPFGKTILADRNPVRTGGPMQVGVTFAESFAAEKPYPYPIAESLRHEVFKRRGGVYFGVAHLLDYPASYPRMLYRFADYNAGHYASRNAAFQKVVSELSGIPLDLDGDLLRYDGRRDQPGSTELALRLLAKRIDLSSDAIHGDLQAEKTDRFEKTRTYERVSALADRTLGKPVPRAMLPRISLHSPKITRHLTTDWFANRVEGRYQACLQRASA